MKQSPRKLTAKQVYAFDNTISVCNAYDDDNKRSLLTVNIQYDVGGLNLHTPPNAGPLHKYEARPSIWIYEDDETGNVFNIYSDCQNKNPWKGTSVEFVSPQKPGLLQAYIKLIAYLSDQDKDNPQRRVRLYTKPI